MKHLFFLLVAILVSVGSMSAADNRDIEFAETAFDFGTVSASHEPIIHEYVFTNTSDVPLTVVSASASCGCTRAKYTNEPVRPGDTGTVRVTFYPKGQKGYISKNVKVRYKLPGKKVRNVSLKLTGNVTPE